jgi:UDP:flavonoid glycosyltransferase YjiC (YdhE family)
MPADAAETRPSWPDAKGPKVLVYLKKGPWLEPVCDALTARKASVVGYVAGLDDGAAGRLERPGLHLARELCKFSELTRESDIVVCHGSQNTASASLLAGKPLVLMPTYVEQLLTSERIVAAGAGAIPRKLDIHAITRSLDAVAPDSPARKEAGKIALRRERKTDSSADVIARIEALA